jgi:predicted Zn-dependent protease
MRWNLLWSGNSDFNFIFAQNYMPATLWCQARITVVRITVGIGKVHRIPVPAESRFYVIEDAAINASALPDGTILVNTGLLGAMENEAQLAFVLSHEITHVVQAHPWRHVHETRNKRILITIAAVAGSGFIGNLGNFFGAIALAAVWNGYGRRLENQADRLGLQNVVDHGYDPRQAPRLSEIIIDHYGDRSTSAIWSNHDSSVLRGSFLTVQIRRRFPGEVFQQKKTDTQAFRDMKEIMGPVKIM